LQELLSTEFLEQAQKDAGVKRNNCVYTPLVIMWLLVLQRLHGGAPLEAAVLELLRGLPASFWPRPCKRIRKWREQGESPSSNTGAYNQARQALPLAIVQQSCERIFQELTGKMVHTLPENTPRAFVLDGSSMRMAHSPELCDLYPPGSNQHGESHWPLLRVLIAHDVYTGLAMRPEWGAMHGENAVSEQGLLEKAIGRLPEGSTVMGDANFGVFSVAWAATQNGHPVLLRLTLERARRLAGEALRDGIDRPLVWKPSVADRRSHPELPADATVSGRLIVRQVQPGNGADPFLLALFTTWQSPQEEMLGLYGRRWAIGVSSQGHIVQSVRDRPRSKDSDLVAGEAPWRESKTAKPSDNMLRKECAQRTRLQRAVNADVASLHEFPVAETVDNARKQQELAETSPKRQFSPAGYQRRHGVKDDVETGEALGARRRNLVEEMPAITASGKCWYRHQGGGSGRSTVDGRAAKRARREGPGPVSNSVRQGEAGAK
jgi:hypothetical protein